MFRGEQHIQSLLDVHCRWVEEISSALPFDSTIHRIQEETVALYATQLSVVHA